MKQALALALITYSLVSLCIVSVEFADATGDSWTAKASMHVARAGLGVAVVDGKIYAIGGATQALQNVPYANVGGSGFVATNEQYDPATDAWTFKEPMPTPRFNFAIAACQGKLYCIGGVSNNGTANANEVYDPKTDSWEAKAPIPTGGGLQASVVGGKIYLIGGSATSASTVNYVYDVAADSWSAKTAMPYSTSHYASTAADDKMYVLGGVDLLAGGAYPNQIYDTKTDSWSLGVAPLLANFGSGAATTTGEFAPKRIYLMGMQPSAKANQPLCPTQIYDFKQNSWMLGAAMPTLRTDFGMAAINDTLYAIGGYSYNNTAYAAGGASYSADAPATPSAINEQYTPIDYGTPDQTYQTPTPIPSPTLSPSPATTPTATSSPTSTPTLSPSIVPSGSLSPTATVPEFPAWTVLALTMITMLSAAAVAKRRELKQS